MDGQIVPSLAKKLEQTEPILSSDKVASVAVIISDRDNPKTLLIRRAQREGDPWSGHIAFPGGKRREGDVSPRGTAIRETNEEIGIDLQRHAKFLGYFRPFRTHTGAMEVVPCIFFLEDEVELIPNAEVSSYRWVPVSVFADPETRTIYESPGFEAGTKMPALAIGDYTVWGLTYSIVSSLLLEEEE